MSDQRSFFPTFRDLPSGSWKVNEIAGTKLFANKVNVIFSRTKVLSVVIILFLATRLKTNAQLYVNID